MAHMNNVQYKGRKMSMKSYFKLVNKLDLNFIFLPLSCVFYESLLAQEFKMRANFYFFIRSTSSAFSYPYCYIPLSNVLTGVAGKHVISCTVPNNKRFTVKTCFIENPKPHDHLY